MSRTPPRLTTSPLAGRASREHHRALILVDLITDLWRYKWSVVRALVVCWTGEKLVNILAGQFQHATFRWANTPWHSELLREIWVYYAAPITVIVCVGLLGVGWLIARLDEEHAEAMVFLCAAVQLPFAVPWALDTVRLLRVGLFSAWDFRLALLFHAVCLFVLFPLAIVLGGLWSEGERLDARIMKAALWLMRRFDVPEPVIGDVVEQATRGRSRLWLWRQVIDATATTTLAAVRNDPRNAALVGFVSFGALLMWVESTWVLHAWVMDTQLGPALVRIGTTGDVEPWQRWMMEWWGPLYALPLGFVWCVGSALIGRAAGDRRAASTVVVSLFAQLPLVCWWGIPLWRNAIDYIGGEAAHPVDVQLVTLTALVWFGIPIATVLAGLSAPRVRRQDPIA